MEDQIEQIMDEIKDMLLLDGNGDVEEINEYCEAYRLHIFFFFRTCFCLLEQRKKNSLCQRRRQLLLLS